MTEDGQILRSSYTQVTRENVVSIQISQLFHFPVKSLKGVRLKQMELDTFGPKWDRRFMLVDKNGRFLTQRECPQMGQIAAKVEGHRLWLQHAGIEQSLDLDALRRFEFHQPVTVWKDKVNARIIQHDINQWISGILQRDLQLCFMDEDTHRQVDPDYAEQGVRASFADGFPILIVSEASIRFLSDKLGRELDIERFRPNIVLTGCDAFAEDQWKKIRINGIEFDLVKPCARCAIPTLDLDTSEQQADVMQVMLKYRKQGKGVMVGQNAIHRGTGLLKVGQMVEVSG